MSKKSNRGKAYFYAMGQRDTSNETVAFVLDKNWPEWAKTEYERAVDLRWIFRPR